MLIYDLTSNQRVYTVAQRTARTGKKGDLNIGMIFVHVEYMNTHTAYNINQQQ